MAAVPNQLASLLQSRMLEAPPPGDPTALSQPRQAQSAFEVKYDEHDILGWVGSVFTWWKKITRRSRGGRRRMRPNRSAPARRFAMAMMADWGTGLYGAPVCARSIEHDPAAHRSAGASRRHLLLRHAERSAHAIPRTSGRSAPMRSAARATPTTRCTPGARGTSECCSRRSASRPAISRCRTTTGCSVGLDSAYEDHDLAGNQVAWLERIVAARRRP